MFPKISKLKVSKNSVFDTFKKQLNISASPPIIYKPVYGGEIVFGNLLAKADENGILDMRYQHLNRQDKLMTGVCRSTPEILPDGRIRLFEKWQWTCGDFSEGESVIEEKRNIWIVENE